MAFFSVPSRPDPADIADALSLAVVTGWVARGYGKTDGRPSLEDGLDQVRPLGEALAQVGRRWTEENTAWGPGSAPSPARLQAALVLASSCLTALVSRSVPPSEGLAQVEGLRSSFFSMGQALSEGVNPETSALLVGGAVQGLVEHGSAPETALDRAQQETAALVGEASELALINQQQFGEDGTPERLSAVAHLYGASLAGLIGQGHTVGEALSVVHDHRGLLFSSTSGLVPTVHPEWLAPPVLGSLDSRRARALGAVAPEPVASPLGRGPRG